RVARGFAEPLGDPLEQLEADRWMLLDQSPEHPRREAEQPDGRGGRHGRGAGAPVEQGDLSEEVSGAEPGPGLAAHAHRRRPFRDEEEPHSPVALARDYVAL